MENNELMAFMGQAWPSEQVDESNLAVLLNPSAPHHGSPQETFKGDPRFPTSHFPEGYVQAAYAGPDDSKFAYSPRHGSAVTFYTDRIGRKMMKDLLARMGWRM